MKVGKYAKTIVTVLLGVGYTAQAAIVDGVITNTEWVGVGLAVLTALGVYAVPNATASEDRPLSGNYQ